MSSNQLVERSNYVPHQQHNHIQRRHDESTNSINLQDTNLHFNNEDEDDDEDSDIQIVSVHLPAEKKNTRLFTEEITLPPIPSLEKVDNEIEMKETDQNDAVVQCIPSPLFSQDAEMLSGAIDDDVSEDVKMSSLSQNSVERDVNHSITDPTPDTVIMVEDYENDASDNEQQVNDEKTMNKNAESLLGLQNFKQQLNFKKVIKAESQASAYEVEFMSTDVSQKQMQAFRKKKIKVRTVLQIIDSGDEASNDDHSSTTLVNNATSNPKEFIEENVDNKIQQMSLDELTQECNEQDENQNEQELMHSKSNEQLNVSHFKLCEIDQVDKSENVDNDALRNLDDQRDDAFENQDGSDDNDVVDETLNELQMMVETRIVPIKKGLTKTQTDDDANASLILSSFSSINEEIDEINDEEINTDDEQFDEFDDAFDEEFHPEIEESKDEQVQHDKRKKCLRKKKQKTKAKRQIQPIVEEMQPESEEKNAIIVEDDAEQEEHHTLEQTQQQSLAKATFDPSLPKIGSSNWPQVFKNLTYTTKHEHFWTDNFNRIHPKWSKVTNAILHRIYQHPGFYVVKNDNLVPSKKQQSKPNNFSAMLKFGETSDVTKRLSDNSFTSCFFPRTWHLLLFIEVDNKSNAQRIESAFKKWLTQRQRIENDVFLLRQRKDVMLVKSWKKLRNDFLHNAHPNKILPTGENFITHFSVKYIGIGKHNDWLIE